MKRFLLYIFLAILSPATFAQVSISGDNSAPDPSAMLDVKSNSRGILLPRIALTAINMAAPVVAPAVGLMVYNTAIAGTSPHNVTHGYYLWDGSVWVPVSAIKGTSIGDMQYWNGFQWVNIPVGTPGQYLQLSSQNIPTWTGSSYPTVVTLPVTLVMQTTATSGGEILSDGGSSLSARGVCWNTTGNPTTADSKTVDGYGIGSFISNLTNLMPGTIYHVRAYATNTAGTSYGAVINFTTLNIPTVSTQFITSITQTTAQGGGHVTADGGSAVTHYGVCWSDNPDPTIGNSKTNDGSGIGLFTSNLTLLTPNTTYYVKAYATNSVGTAYGNQVVFTTLHLPELPVVYTSPVINITNLSAASGGDVTDDGDSPVTVRGVCWSLVQNPTTANNITLNGAGTGVFTSVLTGLLADTVYYIRAYATNISGTAYGNSLSFRTLPDAPPPCPGTPTVSYGGKTYNTVLIGSRCWFKENLDIGIRINGNKEQTDNNDTIEKYCFNNLEANCNIYGGLYQWNELMAYVNISEGMGICPAGWYVPGINEYITLINFLGGISVAGGKMKESGAEHWLSPNTDASNRSGFTGLPGSERSTGGTFPALGLAANIWTSSIYSSGFGALQLHYNSAAGDLIYANSDMGFSARCIKDTCSSHSSVGVIITPSVNPICSGAEVTLTATTTNSGTNPFFQWKINGIKVGTNTQIYSYIPANNDVVTCVLHSSTPCALNPAYSLPVTMIVNQNLPVSVSIAVSANPSCQGNLVAFTAMPTNGGSSPAYQWKVNGTNVTGATNSTFLSIPVNNEVILCILTSSEMCKTNSPATSNDIKMTVHNSEPVSVSIAATANPVCAGTSVTYTATPTNGGASPSYQWKLNGTNVSGATNATYSHIPANGNTIACILTSNLACSTGNPATSNSITMSVTESLPVSVSISASSNPICAGASVTFTATPTNGGSAPAYQWRLDGAAVSGATNAIYTFTPSAGKSVSCVLTSNATCISNNPATSNSVVLTVNPNLPVSVIIAASANPSCVGNSVAFTASPTNGGSSPSFQWRLNETNIPGATNMIYSFIPSTSNRLTCILTSSLTCKSGNPATSNEITMIVNPPVNVGVSIAATANPVCSGISVTYTATPTNGGTSPSYQWKKNGSDISGATNATYSYIPANGNTIACVLTSNLACSTGNPATSNSITMSVTESLPVSVSISASSNPICAGASVTFTATPTNGGSSPAYQWRLDGAAVSGATDAAYTFTPSSGKSVSCVLTSNALCSSNNPATSNSVVLTVNPNLPVSVIIAASANPSCVGNSVAFTASPTNGGTSPSYQWRLNETNIPGATNVIYSFIPSTSNRLTCILTSSLTCKSGNPATSNEITMIVNPPVNVGVSIVASANPVCAGTSVLYTATPTNGGTSPSYQWKKNGSDVPGATNATYSYIPANGNTIECVLNSNMACSTGNPATSNSITMTVTESFPVSVSISASANPICSGTSVTFTATPTNGGSSPAYQWHLDGAAVSGATNAVYTFAPSSGKSVYCVLTSNALCSSNNPATSNSVVLTVNPNLPVSVSIAASANPSCQGNSVTFTATATNGGSSPSYQWKVNGTNVTGATNSIYSSVPINNEAILCILTSSATCKTGSPASSNTINMTVTAVSPVSVSIAASANPVCAGLSVTYTATPTNGGTSPSYQWKLNGTNVSGATNATYSNTPTNGNTIVCVLTSNISCPSGAATSNQITMTVNTQSPVSVSISASSYAVVTGASVTYTATPVNGGSSPVYQWKKNSVVVTGVTGNTYTNTTPANNDNILCIMTSNATICVSGNPATSNTINMIVYTTGTFCPGIPTVVHGGVTYNTVLIGSTTTQCWLRENINLGTMITGVTPQTDNGIIEKYCYNNDLNRCNVYGGLYQWAEMVQYLNGVTNTTHWNPLPTGNVQGVCPTGWHIPTSAESASLVTLMGGTPSAGGNMKEVGLVHWGPYNSGATNSAGFTAIAGGGVYNNTFGDINSYSNFWTITRAVLTASSAAYFGAAFNSSYASSGETGKTVGYSVRCLKD